MQTVVTVFIVIVCILLVLIVLVQNSKGGGLASNFQSSTQFAGVRKTADFLEKATWYLAGALLVLAILGNVFTPESGGASTDSIIRDKIEQTADPLQTPSFPEPDAPSNEATPQSDANAPEGNTPQQDN
ncbi:MAG: preprotein translocase subunit SecG [Bacteroidales bacterium]|jgi:preprotein translocase subunit SecG|nr:preprotein translocase subunit SecG [Bacteroidales bacterium]